MEFRDLRADETECRIGTCNAKGVSLLIYKNARCDMNILDETVGADKWQRRHYECKGNLFCSVGIKCGDEWIWKDDAGAESNTEKEKGESSDSFKRACTNWGIGRELYTAPFIWVNSDNCNIKGEGNKFKCYDKFSVRHIAIVDKKITQLIIYNEKLKRDVFAYGCRMDKSPEPQYEILQKDVDDLLAIAAEKGVTEKQLCKRFHVDKLICLTAEQYELCRQGLMGM